MVHRSSSRMVYSNCKMWHVSSVHCSYEFTWMWLRDLQKQCSFGYQGLNSHSEETKKARFVEFLVI